MEAIKEKRDIIVPIFKFSAEVSKEIYTINSIKSFSSTYRCRNRQLSIFPSDTIPSKSLYLVMFEATKK